MRVDLSFDLAAYIRDLGPWVANLAMTGRGTRTLPFFVNFPLLADPVRPVDVLKLDFDSQVLL